MSLINLSINFNNKNQSYIGYRYNAFTNDDIFDGVLVNFIKPNPDLIPIWRCLRSLKLSNIDNSKIINSNGLCEAKIGMIYDSESKKLDDSVYISSASFSFMQGTYNITEELILYLSMKFDMTASEYPSVYKV